MYKAREEMGEDDCRIARTVWGDRDFKGEERMPATSSSDVRLEIFTVTIYVRNLRSGSPVTSTSRLGSSLTIRSLLYSSLRSSQ